MDDIADEEEADMEEEVAEETGQDLDDRLVIEGVVFSADRPLRIIDIEEATGFERGYVRKALRRLASDYRRRNTSIEVVKVGSRWTMQVRRDYTPSARSVAAPEVDPRYLRTLALIAYHQPVLQSDLQEMMGPKVYDHVRELKALGLINAKRKGSTKELTTTQKFPEYFGIESAKREDIKAFMAKRAGIELPEVEPTPAPAEPPVEAPVEAPVEDQEGGVEATPEPEDEASQPESDGDQV
jgi:segregation and condensation protein B